MPAILARRAQRNGSGFIGLARRSRFARELGGAALAYIERGKLGLEPVFQHGQIVDHELVLAGSSAESEQPLLGTLERRRLERRGGKRLLDLGAGGVGLAQHALECLGYRSEQPARERGLALDSAQRRRKPGAVRPLALQGIERLGELGGDLLGMHHQLAARSQGLFLAALGIELAKLLQRMAEIVGIGARGGDPACMACMRRLRRLPCGVSSGHARDLCAETAKGIDQIAVPAWIDKGAVVVLAVDLDQGLTDLPQ